MKTLGKCLGRARNKCFMRNDKRMSDKLLSLWNENHE